MGFEVLFKFHDRLESGEYDKEETKELKRKVGEPFEDVPMEKLASAVTSQLARRDIWVVDVEIYEYKKQRVNFRETKGGIVIKNKKFVLDQTANLVMENFVEEVSPVTSVSVISTVQDSFPTNNTPAAPATMNKRPIKFVTLDPDIPNLHKVKQSGLAFKPDKKYPVFAAKPHPKKVGINIFTMWDDNQREVNVIDEYFVPAANLQFGALFQENKADAGPQLAYDGLVSDQSIDIRG